MEFIKKLIGDKKAYKQFKTEVAKLPTDYQDAFNALQKYMWNFSKGEGFQVVFDDLLHMFQESAMENIPLKDVIGDDPVQFADELMAQYPDELWIIKMQNKLRTEFNNIGK